MLGANSSSVGGSCGGGGGGCGSSQGNHGDSSSPVSDDASLVLVGDWICTSFQFIPSNPSICACSYPYPCLSFANFISKIKIKIKLNQQLQHNDVDTLSINQ